MKYLLSFLLFFVLSNSIISQNVIVEVIAQESKELLPFALVQIEQYKAFYSDENGKFLINPSAFSNLDTLTISYLGYQAKKIPLNEFQIDQKNIIKLTLLSTTLPMIEVTTLSLIYNQTLSVLSPKIPDLERVPSLAGESDIMKALQLLPGISETVEGTAGLSIRGGNTSQTHLIVDGNPIYNANHIGGFISSVPSYGIKRMDVYKGGIPSRFGGRLSGVVDIQLREGNAYQHKAAYTIGLGLLRLGLEGPVTDNATYLVTGRLAYPTLIERLVNSNNFKKKESGSFESFGLFDTTVKLTRRNNQWTFSSSMFLSGDSGFSQDDMFNGRFTFEDFKWKNLSLVQKIRYDFLSPFTVTGTVQYSNYHYEYDSYHISNANGVNFSNAIKATLSDPSIRLNINYQPSVFLKVEMGTDYIGHQFDHQQLSSLTQEETPFILSQNTSEANFYLQLKTRFFNSKFHLDAGIRNSNLISDQNFSFWEPRLRLGYDMNEILSINGGFDVTTQFVHKIAADFTIFPNEVWLMADENYQPSRSEQVFLGTSFFLEKQRMSLSVEAFKKDMMGLTEADPFRSTEQSTSAQFLENLISEGRGRVKGVEFYLEKKYKKFDFSLAYTLSKSERQYTNINEGKWYPYTYDKRHDIAFQLFCELPRSWSFASSFVFQTGRAITVPIAVSAQFNVFEQLNNGRFPAFHRLNVSLEKKWKGKKRTNHSHSLVFGLYNAYNQKNPYSIAINPVTITRTDPLTGATYQVRNIELSSRSLFPLIPSISYKCIIE